ncbi:MAG: hypothetical protein RL036_262 [Actinomycetota bacterium]|jgi:hypothetical protein
MTSLLTDHIFAADPSAHVFDGRVYVYVSYDEPYTNSYDTMSCYHALSSDNLVDWVDHGRILHLDQVDWALSHMWAIDANYWQGKYYLVFCAIDKATSTFKTGIAISDRPEGPFTNLGTIDGVEWGQDPSLFIDGDQPYLVWGARGSILIGELNQDLMSIKAETIRNLSDQVGGYEGPFLHKYQGRYYLTYPALDNEVWPQRMCHAVADTPLGPYEDLGVFIGVYPGNSGTIHGSVFEFKDKWYAFYHSAWVSGSQSCRSLMLDEIQYSPAGRILEVVPSESQKGRATPTDVNVEVHLDAAVSNRAGGRHFEAVLNIDHEHESDCTGAGYLSGMIQQEYGFSAMLQVGVPREYEVWLRYRSVEPHVARVVAGRHLFYDGNQNQSYDQYINRGTEFASTDGEWVEILIGTKHFEFGDHLIRFSNSHNLPVGSRGIEVDRFRLVPR